MVRKLHLSGSSSKLAVPTTTVPLIVVPTLPVEPDSYEPPYRNVGVRKISNVLRNHKVCDGVPGGLSLIDGHIVWHAFHNGVSLKCGRPKELECLQLPQEWDRGDDTYSTGTGLPELDEYLTELEQRKRDQHRLAATASLPQFVCAKSGRMWIVYEEPKK